MGKEIYYGLPMLLVGATGGSGTFPAWPRACCAHPLGRRYAGPRSPPRNTPARATWMGWDERREVLQQHELRSASQDNGSHLCVLTPVSPVFSVGVSRRGQWRLHNSPASGRGNRP